MSANTASPLADPVAGRPEGSTRESRSRFTPSSLLWAVIPLLLLAGVLAWIVRTDAGLGRRTTPPIETLSVQRVLLPAPNEIEVEVVNGGPDPIAIAQVLVDEAYWQFSMQPNAPLDRLQSARIQIPYPWIAGESHTIALISSTGVVFETGIPVAIESPQPNRESFLRFALVGLYVGVVPVALGLLWYPFLRRLGRRGMNFVLALTVGLLAFLVVDMWEEARETAVAAVGALDAPVLIPLVALLTMGLLVVIGHTLRRRTQRPGQEQTQTPLTLAYQIALGIGLHNLGEGLAIGAAFALGEAALGVFLILGFTLHNVTEGIGIAAPLVRERPALPHFVGLALLAGGPAILGTWIGAFVYSPFWTTIFLAIGIGAILQVIVEVGRLIWRSQEKTGEPALNWITFGGVAAGIAVMYLTALLVAA
jgi:zinc transporter, ZIP family